MLQEENFRSIFFHFNFNEKFLRNYFSQEMKNENKIYGFLYRNLFWNEFLMLKKNNNNNKS
jgi:hypothetical protein